VQERGATARYRLLELIREFERERHNAVAVAAAALHRRHADYYI